MTLPCAPKLCPFTLMRAAIFTLLLAAILVAAALASAQASSSVEQQLLQCYNVVEGDKAVTYEDFLHDEPSRCVLHTSLAMRVLLALLKMHPLSNRTSPTPPHHPSTHPPTYNHTNRRLQLHSVFWPRQPTSSSSTGAPLTIITGLSTSRYDMLEAQCSSYTGPLSAAAYIALVQHSGPITEDNKKLLDDAVGEARLLHERCVNVWVCWEEGISSHPPALHVSVAVSNLPPLARARAHTHATTTTATHLGSFCPDRPLSTSTSILPSRSGPCHSERTCSNVFV